MQSADGGRLKTGSAWLQRGWRVGGEGATQSANGGSLKNGWLGLGLGLSLGLGLAWLERALEGLEKRETRPFDKRRTSPQALEPPFSPSALLSSLLKPPFKPPLKFEGSNSPVFLNKTHRFFKPPHEDALGFTVCIVDMHMFVCPNRCKSTAIISQIGFERPAVRRFVCVSELCRRLRRFHYFRFGMFFGV